MASLSELKQAIRDELAPIKGALANERKRDAADRKRYRQIMDGLGRIEEKVSDDATKSQVRDLRRLIKERLDEPEPTQEES